MSNGELQRTDGIVHGNNLALYPLSLEAGANIVIVQQHRYSLERIAKARDPTSPNRVYYTHRPIIALDAIEAGPVDMLVTGGRFYNKLCIRPEITGTTRDALDTYGSDRVGFKGAEELADLARGMNPQIIVVAYASLWEDRRKFDAVIYKNQKGEKKLINLIDDPRLKSILQKDSMDEKMARLREMFPDTF